MERVRTSPPGLPTQQTTFEVHDTNTMKPVKRLPDGLLQRMIDLFGSANSPARSTIVIDTPWDPRMQGTLQGLQAEFHKKIRIVHKQS